MKIVETGFLGLLLIVSVVGFSQKEQVTDTLLKEKKLSLNVDIVSRYLWRGQCWGGNYMAVQPSAEYAITSGLSIGSWATTNFKKDYFYPDNENYYKGYREIDFYASYQLTDFLQVQIWDYYWPSVSRVEGVSNRFFNYGPTSSQTVDAILYFDFSEGYRFPFNATISTLVGGNDYRYGKNINPKRNYTTYMELGYTFNLFQNIELLASSGVVLNNQAEYYNFANYDKPSFVNLSLKAIKEISLSDNVMMPISLNYVHNGATKNTDFFGKNFLVAGVSFGY
ncbi:TorF family putative porin [Flavobacterium daejeonense]|uniref:TorF family putative porin n=1 Tax=Flavobacterium daejeonense TaxID=350893 RepID=UPI000479030A|nr:TorF family putative porin [Flavobacterium daejeonense]